MQVAFSNSLGLVNCGNAQQQGPPAADCSALLNRTPAITTSFKPNICGYTVTVCDAQRTGTNVALRTQTTLIQDLAQH